MICRQDGQPGEWCAGPFCERIRRILLAERHQVGLVLFLDESGDTSLEKIDPKYPV
jgi:hypothetical protein